MALLLKDSQTKDNLMRAFAGESQARNRYTFAASQAKKDKLNVIEHLFQYTADQEKAHAKVYFDLLKELSGQNITVDGAYPIDIYPDIVQVLRASQHNEFQEHDYEYAHFAKVAREEGFTKVATTFELIGKIEKIHGERFGHFADLIEQNKLFQDTNETEWMCLNCGHVHKGTSAAEVCPVCNHPQGFFIRFDLTPFR